MADIIKKIIGYKFVANQHNEKGMAALLLGIISLIAFFVLIIVSFTNSGQADIRIGTIGMVSMVFALVGFVLGLISFGKKDRNYFFSKLGTLFSFFVLLLWVIIFVIGSY